MKNFKDFVLENVEEELTPEYIEQILRNYYGYKQAYTLDENNHVNLLTNLTMYDIYNKRLLFPIHSAKRIYFDRCGIMSTYGFPLQSIELSFKYCNNIRVLDFSDINTEKIKCWYDDDLRKIKNINSENLLEINLMRLPLLKTINVEKCNNAATVIIDSCDTLDLKNVFINNKINVFSIFLCRGFKDFVDFKISTVSFEATCDFLESFDGFDSVNIEKANLQTIPNSVKGLSKLIESKTIITYIEFETTIDAKYNLLGKIVQKYATKKDKIEHIMDFSLELIESGFEDQL